jgi:ABC-2 type transport system permease protein
MLAVIGALMGFRLVIALPMIPLFILTLILSQILRFMLAYDISLLAFWTQKIESLLSVNDTMVFLLAGQAAPVTLLPGFIGTLATILPYRYMLGFPVEILMGKLSEPQILCGLGIQLFWAAIAIIAYRVIWKNGVRRFSAVGG